MELPCNMPVQIVQMILPALADLGSHGREVSNGPIEAKKRWRPSGSSGAINPMDPAQATPASATNATRTTC
jgi:hypothetical protein